MSNIERVREELELVAKLGAKACIDSAMLVVAAALADAERKGAEAMLEKAVTACEQISDDYYEKERHKYAEMKTDAETGASDCARAIRALPLPTGSQS